MDKKTTGISLITDLQEDSRNIKNDKYVSISISARTHEKLNKICWLIRGEKKPKLGLVTSNIVEHFIEEHRESILKLQEEKNNLF
ncbi:MAG: hypothetical protein MI810_01660 [Flavobacteriales bacterium]|nr:hypothetical protein [Flavobacteriales bacterium]